jgi:hypothetical protein
MPEKEVGKHRLSIIEALIPYFKAFDHVIFGGYMRYLKNQDEIVGDLDIVFKDSDLQSVSAIVSAFCQEHEWKPTWYNQASDSVENLFPTGTLCFGVMFEESRNSTKRLRDGSSRTGTTRFDVLDMIFVPRDRFNIDSSPLSFLKDVDFDIDLLARCHRTKTKRSVTVLLYTPTDYFNIINLQEEVENAIANKSFRVLKNIEFSKYGCIERRNEAVNDLNRRIEQMKSIGYVCLNEIYTPVYPDDKVETEVCIICLSDIDDEPDKKDDDDDEEEILGSIKTYCGHYYHMKCYNVSF